jgi:cell division transport system permease protein
MKAWFNQQYASLREASHRLRRQPVAGLLNALVIGIAISLPTALYLILDNIQGATRQISKEPQVSLFMATDATAEDVSAVQQSLRGMPEVGSVRLVPKDKALEDLKANSGVGDILSELDRNPLPDAFIVTASDRNPKTLEHIRQAATKWQKVDHVQVDSEWARRLFAILRVGQALVAVLAVLLGAAVVAVTFNTIRLQILTRQEEIDVTRLIGATNDYIRRPFLYAGAVQGVAGAGFAYLLVVIIAAWLNYHLSDLSILYTDEFRLRGLSPIDLAILLGFASALGWLGAWLSVTRHLWRSE